MTKEKGLHLKLTETTEEEVDTSNQETAEVPLEVAESAQHDAIIIPTGAVRTVMTEEIITEDKVLKTADMSKKGVKTRAENKEILRKPDKISEKLTIEFDDGTRGGKSEKVPEQKKIGKN